MFYSMHLMVLAVVANVHVSQSADASYLNRSITNQYQFDEYSYYGNRYNENTKVFIYDEFERFGLDTHFHDTETRTSNYWTRNSLTNIIGIRKGKNFGTASDRIIGVCAHYNTMEGSQGVDDNGSGVAALLEVVRQLNSTNFEFEHTVIFISPDRISAGENYGSQTFMNDWFPQWLRENYIQSAYHVKPYGFLVLDTVMQFDSSSYSQRAPADQDTFPKTLANIQSDDYRGDFIALIYRDASDVELAERFKEVWKQDHRKQYEIEEFRLGKSDIQSEEFFKLCNKDNTEFWLSGVPAILLTDTAHYRGVMKNCTKASCDDLPNMLTDENIAFLGKTADIVTSTIVDMATAKTNEVTEKKSTVTEKKSTVTEKKSTVTDASCTSNTTSTTALPSENNRGESNAGFDYILFVGVLMIALKSIG